MKAFSVTNQNDIFPRNDDSFAYQIKDDLLYHCIGLGGSYGSNQSRITGFNAGKGLGSALLTYFVSRALGVWRIPFCEDRTYSDSQIPNDKHKDIICSLTEKKILNICNEVEKIYQNTQQRLKDAGLGTVFLRREIRYTKNNYAENIIRHKQASELLNLKDIQIEMDILNSFGDEGAYESSVCLELEIPVEDVFYCSNLIANREGTAPTMESGEWIVINRSATGVVSIPTSSVNIREDMWKDKIEFTKTDAENFLSKYSPIVLRSRLRHAQHLGTQHLRPSFKHKLVNWLLGYSP